MINSLLHSRYTRCLLATAALILVCLSTAACGVGTTGSLGLAAADHTSYAHHHPKVMNDIRCGWHSYRAVHDLRHHSLLWGAYQAYEGVKSCSKASH
jgi:hypothetical protein